jgi:hypothetical protein
VNKDDIIRIAREAGIEFYPSPVNDVRLCLVNNLEHFAALVAAAEREACAKLCESLNEDFDSLHVESCAEAIRSRGEN